MREVKFRGKSIKTNKWFYGSLDYDPDNDEAHILWYEPLDGDEPSKRFSGQEEVDPETVGQHSGLKDKNGVEIYEGDIMEVTISSAIGNEEEYPCEIRWNDEGGMWDVWLHGKGEYLDGWYDDFHGISQYEAAKKEIIGNVHEDSNLLSE